MELSTASLEAGGMERYTANGAYRLEGAPRAALPGTRDQEALRKAGWEIGEGKSGEWFVPPANLVGLAMVHPTQGFAYWRLRHDWVERASAARGGEWEGA